MKFSDIETRHIYNVIFDPVEYCEFNGKHLALVLKKNNDRQTLVVMPLTSESNGNGVNKIKVGTIPTLPTSLRNNNTYAVFNQIRTVSIKRFISLKEGSNVIACPIDDDLFLKLIDLGTSDIMFYLNFDEKITLYKKKYKESCISKAVALAYTILNLKNEISKLTEENQKDPIISVKEKEIESIENEIRDILNNDSNYELSEIHIKNGIDKILDAILK